MYPDFTCDFILETNASSLGLGAILSQSHDNFLHPVAYASRALSQSERRYGITDLETLAIVWACTHFHAYLYGHRVTIFTDHLASKSVLENPSSNGKHAHWWTKIYKSGIQKVTIVYHSGKSNVKADGLSKNPYLPAPLEDTADSEVQVTMTTTTQTTSSVDSNSSITDLLQAAPVATPVNEEFGTTQHNDPELLPIITYLKKDELPTDHKMAKKISSLARQMVMSNGILYYVDSSNSPHGNRNKVVVPKELRQLILASSHAGLLSGHFSARRLYNTLLSTWWWKSMYADAVQYCSSCTSCVVVSGGGRVHRPLLHPIPVFKF